MQTSRKGILLATALAFGAALAAPAAHAQTSTGSDAGSDEAQPMPMPQLSPSDSTANSATLMLLNSKGLNPHPIREPVMGGPIPAPIPINANLKSATGKLFLEIGGNPHYCTGLFVLEQVIVTAAHCVQENGSLNKYALTEFKREGEDEVYNVKSGCVRVPKEWETTTDQYLRIDFDYAFIKLERAMADPLKVQLVNASSYGKAVAAVGYAASAAPNLIGIWEGANQDPLHPRLMHLSTASTGFTEGTSGGAWIWDKMADSKPLKVVSINSSYATPFYTSAYIRLYGPNFTRDKRNNDETVASDLLGEADGC